MSATLRVDDFTQNNHLFGANSPLEKLPICVHHIENSTIDKETDKLSKPNLPVINIKARQFDVKKFTMKVTPEDNEYVDLAVKKVQKIHDTLPNGDILVFVSTANECNLVCRKLGEIFKNRGEKIELKLENINKKLNVEADLDENSYVNRFDKDSMGPGYKGSGVLPMDEVSDKRAEEKLAEKTAEKNVEKIELKTTDLFTMKHTLPNYYKMMRDDNEEAEDDDDVEPVNPRNLDTTKETDLEFENEDGEVEPTEEQFSVASGSGGTQPLRSYPLYAKLPPEKQAKIFNIPENLSHIRRVTVATNVAETSLTIPRVRYVIDTGKVKRRVYDKQTGISTVRFKM